MLHQETFSLDYDELNVEQTINKVNDILEETSLEENNNITISKLDNEIIKNNFNEIPKNKLEIDYLERKRKDYIEVKQAQNKEKIDNLTTEKNQKANRRDELYNGIKPLQNQELEAKSKKTQLENNLETLKNNNNNLQRQITNWKDKIQNEPSSTSQNYLESNLEEIRRNWKYTKHRSI
ncbi:MAG: hypothetical protein ACQBVK_01920 [Candidatus Phytoplasma sp. TWB_XP]